MLLKEGKIHVQSLLCPTDLGSVEASCVKERAEYQPVLKRANKRLNGWPSI